MFRLLSGALLGALLISCTNGCQSEEEKPVTETPASTFLILRHAEKVDDSADPELSAAGQARAQALATQLKDLKIDAIYATEYQRTQNTVAPLAAEKQISVQELPAVQVAPLTQKLLNNHKGQTVVACGHSNTVPQILKGLGVADAVVLNDTDYGDLFRVTIDDTGHATLKRERFGD